MISFDVDGTLLPTEHRRSQARGPWAEKGEQSICAGRISFSSSMTCQVMFLELGSGRGASGWPHSYESWSFWGHWLHIWGEGPKSAPKGRNEDRGLFQGRNSKVWGWDRGPTSLGLEDTLPVYNDYKYKSSHGITPPWFPDALSFDPHSGPVFHQLFVPSMQFPVPCLCIAAITSEFPSPRKPFSFFFFW